MCVQNSQKEIWLSDRFMLSPFCPEDAGALFLIQHDPVVSRYLVNANNLSEARLHFHINESRRDKYGFAPWVVRDRKTNRIIGYGGLTIDSADPGWGIEVIYFFSPEYWGRGLATELVEKSLSVGFGVLGLDEINAYAMPGNKASIRVLEKCGFRFQKYEPSLKRNHYLISGGKGQ